MVTNVGTLKVTFTVKNTSSDSTIMRGQAPRLDMDGGADPGDLDNGYVYDQDECFNSNTSGSYPAFPKEDDRFRVVLGIPGWDERPNAGRPVTIATASSFSRSLERLRVKSPSSGSAFRGISPARTLS